MVQRNEKQRRGKLPAPETVIAVLCWIVVPFNLVFTAVSFVPGLDYLPGNKGIWLGCTTALLAAALLIRPRDWRRGGWRVFLMPVVAAGVFRLYVGAEGMGPIQNILALADLILAVILFVKSRTGGPGKALIGALSVLLVLIALSMVTTACLFGNVGITLRRYPDPSGGCEAEVRISDAGALGGSTIVTVIRSSLALPFGELRRVGGEYRTGWIRPDKLDVQWLEDGDLMIQGEKWNWKDAP